MYVQRAEESTASDPSSETQMETFAEVRQIWAPLRRKYELFLRCFFIYHLRHSSTSPIRDTSNSDPILSTPSDPQPTPPPSLFSQFAYVDAPFLAWDFPLQGEHGQEIGLVTRSFRGFGREVRHSLLQNLEPFLCTSNARSLRIQVTRLPLQHVSEET